MNFFYANTFIDYNIKPSYLQQLPIRTINFSNRTDKARHDKMVKLVERMLGLHNDLAKAKGEQDRTFLQRHITSTDRQINHLVYDLYSLTKEEIKLVEASTL